MITADSRNGAATMPSNVCSDCAFVNPEGFRFCGQCGGSLAVSGEGVGHDDNVNGSRVERRQVTVLFCDLVGSTKLSQQLDPEDLRDVIRRYQLSCEPVIDRHGGYISRFLGDGILAYFGYPLAHEDDAVHAVQAGLDIIATVGAIGSATQPVDESAGPSLSVRLGIATGLVIAGDIIGRGAAREEVVFGETPNLAARLQSLAQPNTLLIGSRTRRLVGERFELRALPDQQLKGFAEPMDTWQVIAPIQVTSRKQTRRAAAVTPMIGRQSELDFLFDRWSESRAGRSRVVVVSCEPGIGKSRLVDALRARIDQERHFCLQFQCSAQVIDTAFHPLIAQLEHEAGIEHEDDTDTRTAKLDSILRFEPPFRERERDVFGELLGLASDADAEFQVLDARERKETMFTTLIDLTRALGRLRPILMVVEDLQWIDASSLELLERVRIELRSEPLFVVVTRRSDSDVTLKLGTNIDQVSLPRLDAELSAALVREVVRGSAFPTDLIGRIVGKADGVPLFVEELTKTLMSPGFRAPSRGSAEQDNHPGLNIPDTLHDSLMARLDQLHPGKRVAQIASIFGRDFHRELVRALGIIDENSLVAGLEQLLAAGLLSQVDSVGSTGSARYRFTHVLVRDTAYGSLLRKERRGYHRLAAAALSREALGASPELLARHYTEAGMDEQAIECWLRAGKASCQRSAMIEAVNQFHSGLALLRRRSAGSEHDAQRLEYLVNLGPALIATLGSGAAETESTYRKAIELCERLPVSETHFTALWGWWRISKDFRSKAKRAAQLQSLSEQLGSDALKMQAHHCQWPTRFYLGQHERALQHIRDGLAVYEHGDYREDAARYGGHDARSCAHGNAAQSLWLLGYPEQAVRTMQQAREWAEKLEQAGSLVNVMDAHLLLLRYRDEARHAARQADELTDFARRNRFAEYEVKSQVFRGWARARLGAAEEGIALMRASIDQHREIGTNEDPPVWLEMLAEGCLHAGDFSGGLEVIDEAFHHTERSGLQFWLAELHRRRGELLSRLGPTQTDAAWVCFEEAETLAVKQGARSLQLRASLSALQLALRLEMPDRVAHHAPALETLLARFDEGRDTPDQTRARAVLASTVSVLER